MVNPHESVFRPVCGIDYILIPALDEILIFFLGSFWSLLIFLFAAAFSLAVECTLH